MANGEETDDLCYVCILYIITVKIKQEDIIKKKQLGTKNVFQLIINVQLDALS